MTTAAPSNPYQSPAPAPALPEPAAAEAEGGLSTLALSGMVVLAAVAMAATLPGRTHGLGLITEGLLADVAMPRSDYATLNLVATLIGALFCWPCGWLLDRLGMRITSAAVLALLGISTLGIAATDSVPMLWVWVTLTRGLGQSMLSVVSITLIGKASIGPRHRHAMAGYALLVSVLFIIAFQVMGPVIRAAGWRVAWQGLGWTVLLLTPLFAVLVVEPRRETSTKEKPVDDNTSSATVSQALASPAFWIFVLTSSLYALVSSGVSLFNQSILAERRFDASVFITVLSISTFAGLISNLGTGWLVRYVSYSRLMAASMALYTVALLAFPFVTQLWQVYAYSVAIGLCGGVVTVVFFGVWSHAYGRDHLGKIQGLAQAATVLASAVGPMVFNGSLEQFGSYAPAFWIIAPCVGVLAVAAWMVRTPRAVAGKWDDRMYKGQP
jgi:MFS family permease